MSNIYKSMWYTGSDSTRVIDNNEIISEKLEKIRIELDNQTAASNEGEFIPGLDGEQVEMLLGDNEEQQGDLLASAEEKAQEMIERAKADADRIIEVAQQNASSILENSKLESMKALERATKEGFTKGLQDARVACEAEYADKLQALEEERMQLLAEVQQQKEEMEPLLVETILDVFSDLTHVLSKDKKDLILTIVNSVLEDIEIGKNYLIRVSKEDAIFLRENKHMIKTKVSDVNIEVVEDPFMEKGQCIIDTETGLIDCSLDIRLEELTNNIKMLSCMGSKK